MVKSRTGNWVGPHRFITFVVLTYGISWSLWLIAALGGGQVPFPLGALGPDGCRRPRHGLQGDSLAIGKAFQNFTASDMLQELDVWLNEPGASLVFAEMKDPMREKIERYEATRTIDPAHFSRTLHGAVAECVRETGAAWRSPGTAL